MVGAVQRHRCVPNPANTANYAIINPAGPDASVLNPPLWQIVTNINGTRSYFTNVDGLVGVFEHKGDILSVPQLSNPSLFFNGLNPTNQISDAMYEWLPQQVMSLLRVGTPRYVIYSYGQALKPAPTPNGVYLGNGSLLVTELSGHVGNGHARCGAPRHRADQRQRRHHRDAAASGH